ncbi:hypothetical protein [Nostoc sp. 'Peltigera membranacea cyanobiont' N6]|uniref:hypothetical protein n=1 Tax=Nostoc sp. 'Peltigera membranacea cyanobiont' N6 TaxID=1261031 RepID=UPI0011B02205|nr:hypothetical protein [Nostoc sp. 'Peltigera membranacea cyanobiont' N6]
MRSRGLWQCQFYVHMGKLAQKWEQWTRDFSGGGREWGVGDAVPLRGSKLRAASPRVGGIR